MAEVHDTPGPRLTQAQRQTLIGWIAAGITDYTAIKKLLRQHGFPLIQRQNLDYYRKTYGSKEPRCPRCGRPFETAKAGGGAAHPEAVGSER